MTDKKNLGIIFQVLILVLLSFASVYIFDVFSCGTRLFLYKNTYIKYFVLFLVVYFSIVYADGFKSSSGPAGPFTDMAIALGITIGISLMLRAEKGFIFANMLILLVNYIVYYYYNYCLELRDNETEGSDEYKKYDNIKTILFWVVISLFIVNAITIILGVILYYNKQKKDKEGQWSWKEFFFGRKYCESVDRYQKSEEQKRQRKLLSRLLGSEEQLKRLEDSKNITVRRKPPPVPERAQQYLVSV